jgi:hypothetical protein
MSSVDMVRRIKIKAAKYQFEREQVMASVTADQPTSNG